MYCVCIGRACAAPAAEISLGSRGPLEGVVRNSRCSRWRSKCSRRYNFSYRNREGKKFIEDLTQNTFSAKENYARKHDYFFTSYFRNDYVY